MSSWRDELTTQVKEMLKGHSGICHCAIDDKGAIHGVPVSVAKAKVPGLAVVASLLKKKVTDMIFDDLLDFLCCEQCSQVAEEENVTLYWFLASAPELALTIRGKIKEEEAAKAAAMRKSAQRAFFGQFRPGAKPQSASTPTPLINAA